MVSALQVVTGIGHLKTITKLSGYRINETESRSLVEDGHVGCDLDEYAKDFSHRHHVPRLSSVDGLFALGNGDLAFVEFKDDKVLESISPRLRFVHNHERCYEAWVQKKLYDSFIMLHTDYGIKIEDAKKDHVAYIVVAARKNGMSPGGFSSRMDRLRANEIEVFKGLHGYLYRHVLLVAPDTFRKTVTPRIDRNSQGE